MSGIMQSIGAVSGKRGSSKDLGIMSGADFQLVGIQQFKLMLAAMPADMRKKGTLNAIRAAGKIATKAAKRNMPKETGLLRTSIGMRTKRYRSGVAIAFIGARTDFKSKKRAKLTGTKAERRPSKYLHLIELGVAPHIIRIEKKKAMAFGENQLTFATAVKHPGVPGRHPIGRALVSTRGAQKTAMAESLKKTILGTVRKRRKR